MTWVGSPRGQIFSRGITAPSPLASHVEPPLNERWGTIVTIDGEMDPRSIDADIITAVKKQHRTLVPPLVRHPDVRQLDRRLSHGSNATVEWRVHARRVAVEQNEDRRLDAELAPRDDVLDVDSVRIADLALQYPAGAERRRLSQWSRSCGVIVVLLRRHVEDVCVWRVGTFICCWVCTTHTHYIFVTSSPFPFGDPPPLASTAIIRFSTFSWSVFQRGGQFCSP